MEKDQRHQRLKFYFDGDSFTYGGGLKKKYGADPRKVRWSKTVSDHFGAEEVNIAKSGASNDRVLRHLFNDNFDSIKDYDFIFIQLTFPIRNEFWSDKFNRWFSYSLIKDFIKSGEMDKYEKHFGPEYSAWFDYYASRICTMKHGMSRELVAYNSIVSYLKLLDKPFLILGLSHYDHIDYDFNLCREKYDRIPKDGHPSVHGHNQIAERIIHKVKDKL